jgi:DNA helicase-2/ATP-dependent DNA helicase PcrA
VRPLPPPVPPKRPEGTEEGGFAEGMLVRHATYGTGRVLELSGYGAMRRIRIRFQTAGERTFVLNKVTLEVIGKG